MTPRCGSASWATRSSTADEPPSRAAGMIERTDHDGVAVVRLAHGRASAMDVELFAAIEAALDAAAGARAIVLTGTGGIFSAGVDLKRLLAEDPGYLAGFLPALARMLERVFFLPQPVVAAVNGHAVAGGCVLACAADHRVMAGGPGRIGVTELLVGVPFPAVALEIMRFVVPPHRLQDTVYLGRTHDPEAAMARGLVDEVVEPDRLLPRAVEVAHALAAIPPGTFALTKRQLRQPVRDFLAVHGAALDAAVAPLWAADAVRAVARGYVERVLGRAGAGRG
jgi:enoyl-CoA hydratase